jgi:acyl-ACP thioesterase
MKIAIEKRVGFFELNTDLTLRTKFLLNYFQEAATVHSDRAGYGFKKLMAQGKAWTLYRIGINIHRPPALGDDLQVHTWSWGMGGIRAYRDFEIWSADEKLVSATSVWVLIDLNRKKILRIPSDARECYTVEDIRALDMDIDTWKPNMKFDPDRVKSISTRPSDYDPLGHVNNALYFDFLEIITAHAFADNRKIQRIFMQFNKEIPIAIQQVDIGMRANADQYHFKLFSPECVHAAGNFQLFSPLSESRRLME